MSENFQFLVVKFSIYFNRRVFVMALFGGHKTSPRTHQLVTRYNINYLGPALVAQLDASPTGDQEVVGSTPPRRKHSFAEI